MSKILFISNLSNSITSFAVSSIQAAHDLNIDFYQAANWSNADKNQILSDESTYNITIKHVPISRNPLSKSNFAAYRELVKYVQQENIDYIHCNTPTGGVIGRLVGKKCKIKKVIYTAHGFHFYKGAPILQRTIFKFAEKAMARLTDAIITMNKEDYQAAQNFKLRNGGRVYKVHGVGIDTAQYKSDQNFREEKRMNLNLSKDDVALISMGDLIKRKNYDTAIRAIAESNNSALHYFICGKGCEEENLKALADSLGVSEQIHFLGFRSDIKELLAAADVFLFTTKQEGLPRSLMEAMASGLPAICSKIRGNTDLIDDGKGGYLCNPCNVHEFSAAINSVAENETLRRTMGSFNKEKIKAFDTSVAKSEMLKIYNEVLGG